MSGAVSTPTPTAGQRKAAAATAAVPGYSALPEVWPQAPASTTAGSHGDAAEQAAGRLAFGAHAGMASCTTSFLTPAYSDAVARRMVSEGVVRRLRGETEAAEAASEGGQRRRQEAHAAAEARHNPFHSGGRDGGKEGGVYGPTVAPAAARAEGGPVSLSTAHTFTFGTAAEERVLATLVRLGTFAVALAGHFDPELWHAFPCPPCTPGASLGWPQWSRPCGRAGRSALTGRWCAWAIPWALGWPPCSPCDSA